MLCALLVIAPSKELWLCGENKFSATDKRNITLSVDQADAALRGTNYQWRRDTGWRSGEYGDSRLLTHYLEKGCNYISVKILGLPRDADLRCYANGPAINGSEWSPTFWVQPDGADRITFSYGYEPWKTVGTWTKDSGARGKLKDAQSVELVLGEAPRFDLSKGLPGRFPFDRDTRWKYAMGQFFSGNGPWWDLKINGLERDRNVDRRAVYFFKNGDVKEGMLYYPASGELGVELWRHWRSDDEVAKVEIQERPQYEALIDGFGWDAIIRPTASLNQ